MDLRREKVSPRVLPSSVAASLCVLPRLHLFLLRPSGFRVNDVKVYRLYAAGRMCDLHGFYPALCRFAGREQWKRRFEIADRTVAV